MEKNNYEIEIDKSQNNLILKEENMLNQFFIDDINNIKINTKSFKVVIKV